LKALRPEVASKVVCFVDVDQKKIELVKFYDNGRMRIPILHFTSLARADVSGQVAFGRVEKKTCRKEDFDIVPKKQPQQPPKATSKRKKKGAMDNIDPEVLQHLPVVVCVAMYRTNGALESNVASIGRDEGKDLWHII